MSDTVPAAPDTLAAAMRALEAGKFHGLRDPQSLKVNGARSGDGKRYVELVARHWAEHTADGPQLTEAGRAALTLNELGLRGMTISQARLLLAVANNDAVKVGPDTRIRVNDRGREAYHLAPAIPVYLDRTYGLAELLPGSHAWRLTDKGRIAAELLASLNL